MTLPSEGSSSFSSNALFVHFVLVVGTIHKFHATKIFLYLAFLALQKQQLPLRPTINLYRRPIENFTADEWVVAEISWLREEMEQVKHVVYLAQNSMPHYAKYRRY